MPQSFPRSPRTERLTLSRKQSATESNFNYNIQVVQTASQWMLEWTWPPVTHERAEALSAWLLSLKGQIGTFTYAPRQSVASALTGKTLAANAFAYNEAISVGGYAANAPSTLRPGQWFQLGNQLLRITNAGANANGSGVLTISFEPELRINYASGVGLEFVNPKGIFRLASPDGAGFTLDPDRHPDLGTLQAREVV